MLVNPVIITGDRTRANVCFSAHGGVSNVGQVISFSAGTKRAVFHFNEITDPGPITQISAGC